MSRLFKMILISTSDNERLQQVQDIVDRSEYLADLVSNVFTWLVSLGVCYLVSLLGVPRLRLFAMVITIIQFIPNTYRYTSFWEIDLIPFGTMLLYVIGGILVSCVFYIAIPMLVALFFEIDLYLSITIVSLVVSIVETVGIKE